MTEATWGRANVYDAKCLTELEKLLADLQAIRADYPDDGWTRTPEGDAALDARRVAAGFSAARYNHVLPESGMLTEQDALALARQVLESDGGLSADVLNDPESEMYAVCTQEDGKTVWTVWHHNAVGICAVAIDSGGWNDSRHDHRYGHGRKRLSLWGRRPPSFLPAAIISSTG